MDQEQIKENVERFKRWQLSPTNYEFANNEVQHCHNCEHDFTGNYCPYCSQKAGEGPINWSSVRQSFMDIWGLGSRSLPRTIWHLLLRPGYLISDYIDGKRQVSFPPVKMLFIVAVIVVVLIYYLLPLLLGRTYDVYGGQSNAYVGFNDWIQGHFAWSYFIMALLYVLPTLIMFRYSPRHNRHTLPQGFFIQVFLCVLNLVLTGIVLLPLLLIDYSVFLSVSAVLVSFYYVIAYKQLFGYGLWGTIWRVVFVIGSIVFFIGGLMFIFFQIDVSQVEPNEFSSENSRFYYAGNIIADGLKTLGAGWIINLIATRVSQLKLKKTKQ